MECGESGKHGQIALLRVGEGQGTEQENVQDQNTGERNVREKHQNGAPATKKFLVLQVF